MSIRLADIPPHIRAAMGEAIPTKSARAARGSGRVGRAKTTSALESKFLERWTLLGGPLLEREYRAVQGRRWRFDFAHVPSSTLFELHGGVWTEGRHTRGGGFTADRRKMNAATAAGYGVFELTGGADLSATNVERLIGVVREREAARAAAVAPGGAEGQAS